MQLPRSIPLPFSGSSSRAGRGVPRTVLLMGREVKIAAFSLADPRLAQVGILTFMHVLAHGMLPFPVSVWQEALAVLVCALLDGLLTLLTTGVLLVPLSGVIAALSLTMLVSFESMPLLLTLNAAAVMIVGKHLVQWRGRHLFNPSNFGVVWMLVFLPGFTRIAPAAWPSTLFLFGLLTLIGLRLVLKAKVWTITLVFLLTELALFLAFDAAAYPTMLACLQGIAQTFASPLLLIFSFLMITDPRTAPATLKGRMLFAQLAAVLHYALRGLGFGAAALFLGLFCIYAARPFFVRWKLGLE